MNFPWRVETTRAPMLEERAHAHDSRRVRWRQGWLSGGGSRPNVVRYLPGSPLDDAKKHMASFFAEMFDVVLGVLVFNAF